MQGVPTIREQTVMRIHIKQSLFLKRDDIPRQLLDDIASTLTIENPKYKEAERAGRWTGHLEKVLTYYEVRANDKGDKFLVLPRGFLPSLLKLCNQHQVRWELLQ